MKSVDLGSVRVDTGPPAYEGARCAFRPCASRAETQLTFQARRKHACARYQDEVAHELVRPEAEKRGLREAEKMLKKTLGRSRTIKIKL